MVEFLNISMDNKKYQIGIDEVGRGPIAGPVAVCSFLVEDDNFLASCTDLNFIKEKKLSKLRDSKKLSKKQRENWFEFLKVAKTEGFCDFAVSFVSPENIDKFGISKCIQKALNKSLENITQNILFARSSDEGDGSGARPSQKEYFASFSESDLKNPYPSLYDLCSVFLDGGLKAPKEFKFQKTIIKGDELYPVISMASIVAKVSRDRIMEGFAKKYPEYGFERHVGYGTRVHYEAIKKHGQTPIHRKSFIH